MKEYLAGPSSQDLDRRNCTIVVAGDREEAVRKARILGAETDRGLLIVRGDGEDTEHSVSPVDHREIERQKRIELERLEA